MDYHVSVSSAEDKGYAVGIYGSNGRAVFNSSSFEPSFPRVINKLTSLALDHPEAFREVSIFISPPDTNEWEEAIRGLQKLIRDLPKKHNFCLGTENIMNYY